MSYKSNRKEPLIWIFIDEAHEFLPKIGKTPASDALIQLLREGRQPGISLVMATQQPGQIHLDAMTQSDLVIAHRVTAKPDIEALNEIMQTYVLENIKKQLDDLPALKGSALVLDDNSERIYPIRVRPRFTWHGGEAPSSIKTDLKL
jgi:histidinol phosphatase-like enzyme